MKTKLRYIAAIAAAFVLILVCIMPFGTGAVVHAAEAYTDVLEDLQKDSTFMESDYPDNATDYSLQVIQVAESDKGELFVYAYQPAANSKFLTATDINMSLSEGVDGTALYELEFLSRSGVFCKYKVIGITVKRDMVRRYNITSIYRKCVKGIDADAPAGSSTSKVAFGVAQLWTAVTIDNEVYYDCKDIDVLDVTKQFVDFFRYDDGFQWAGWKNCDAHFFAFSCDHDIDSLLSADISFYTQEYSVDIWSKSVELSDEKTHHFITVDSTMEGHSKKETWQRLSSVDEFLADHELSAEEKERLSEYDWIINFYETEYEADFGGKDIFVDLVFGLLGCLWTYVNSSTTYGVLVTDVTLLRLEFKHDGNIYNLGVVSDMQSGGLDPFGSGSGMPDWLKWVFGALALVLLVVILAAIFPPIIQGLIWVILLPFKLIGALFEGIDKAVKKKRSK